MQLRMWPASVHFLPVGSNYLEVLDQAIDVLYLPMLDYTTGVLMHLLTLVVAGYWYPTFHR